MVFQSYALYPHMSVYDNMAFGLKLRKMPKAEIDRRVKEAADILRIGQLLDRKPKQLSGGQRQRVALGRAIVREPKVFLMDEPLSNLDAKLRVQTRAEISKLHQRLQTTIIYVTHDQVEAMTMGTRIAVMNGGLLQQLDTPQNLYDQPVNMFVAGFIGSPAMNFFGDDPNLPPVRLVGSAGGDVGGRRHLQGQDPGGQGRRCWRKHVNREVILGIRPEECYDRQFALNATPDNTVKVTVDVVEPMGSEVNLYLLTGKKTFVGQPGFAHPGAARAEHRDRLGHDQDARVREGDAGGPGLIDRQPPAISAAARTPACGPPQ